MGKPRDPEGLDLLGFKKCTVCGRWIPRTEFYKNKKASDKIGPRCKQCNSESSMKSQRNHPEARKKAYAKWRAANLEAARENYNKWYANHREERTTYNREYGREYKKQPMPAWKNKIRRETKQLIINGIILHPGCCEDCGVVADSETTIHIHHLTYLRPDRVLFLCPQCHQRWHSENQSPPEPTQEWVEHWYETYNDYPEEE